MDIPVVHQLYRVLLLAPFAWGHEGAFGGRREILFGWCDQIQLNDAKIAEKNMFDFYTVFNQIWCFLGVNDMNFVLRIDA